MQEDFSVPMEFEICSNNLFEKNDISKREFVELCLLATRLIDTNWDKRQGMAYHIAGTWLKYKNIREDELLGQIGGVFGSLELPDHHAAGTEIDVRKKWAEVCKLIKEAANRYI